MQCRKVRWQLSFHDSAKLTQTICIEALARIRRLNSENAEQAGLFPKDGFV